MTSFIYLSFTRCFKYFNSFQWWAFAYFFFRYIPSYLIFMYIIINGIFNSLFSDFVVAAVQEYCIDPYPADLPNWLVNSNCRFFWIFCIHCQSSQMQIMSISVLPLQSLHLLFRVFPNAIDGTSKNMLNRNSDDNQSRQKTKCVKKLPAYIAFVLCPWTSTAHLIGYDKISFVQDSQ